MSTTVAARWVVLDIEGTLTATSQVHEVLYDYARPRLGPWIDAHPDDPAVAAAVADIIREADLPADAGTEQITTVLHAWMDADRKATALKTLQGQIWQDGYTRGALTTDYFPDVVPALRTWHDRGLQLAVFSSGSVTAQRASFSHTTHGDLRELFDAHFDTANAGPKREPDSYRAITAHLQAPPEQIVFCSDVPAELDAAAATGWHTLGLARPAEPFADADFGDHPAVTSFDDVHLEATR
ncbi:acireductone synthase [Saccharopolyspora sp. HNM0983]|uniref:Enolase-phosphatase E1 n=1 Tax=Saccharopolyspora montiporae TaxID=2781240 RepID=A0A929G1S3_9PSEU|nr:acireductone synthase [Saccharopolyspora sp. HNM0983]